MKVYLNAGHGVGKDGHTPDSGAVGPTGLHEAEVTAKIVRRAAAYLQAAGHEVKADNEPRRSFLQARLDAIAWGADVLVSVHCNAAPTPAANGVETLYRRAPGKALALAVQEEVLKGIRTGANPTEVSDRGVKLRADLGVINTAFASCLVECLFISNPAEETMLRQVAWQNTFGWCIAQGVLKWARGR